jgi:hypothetical protein
VTKPIANPNVADNTMAPDSPYIVGWNAGKKFAEDRAINIERLDLDAGIQDKLRVYVDRATYYRLRKIWAERTHSMNTYPSVDMLLHWAAINIPEMKEHMTWVEGQGYIKGFNAGIARMKERLSAADRG